MFNKIITLFIKILFRYVNKKVIMKMFYVIEEKNGVKMFIIHVHVITEHTNSLGQ